jgi:hypothetical protein
VNILEILKQHERLPALGYTLLSFLLDIRIHPGGLKGRFYLSKR